MKPYDDANVHEYKLKRERGFGACVNDERKRRIGDIRKTREGANAKVYCSWNERICSCLWMLTLTRDPISVIRFENERTV